MVGLLDGPSKVIIAAWSILSLNWSSFVNSDSGFWILDSGFRIPNKWMWQCDRMSGRCIPRTEWRILQSNCFNGIWNVNRRYGWSVYWQCEQKTKNKRERNETNGERWRGNICQCYPNKSDVVGEGGREREKEREHKNTVKIPMRKWNQKQR